MCPPLEGAGGGLNRHQTMHPINTTYLWTSQNHYIFVHHNPTKKILTPVVGVITNHIYALKKIF